MRAPAGCSNFRTCLFDTLTVDSRKSYQNYVRYILMIPPLCCRITTIKLSNNEPLKLSAIGKTRYFTSSYDQNKNKEFW